MALKKLNTVPVLGNSQFIIKPFIEKGLTYKIASNAEFIEIIKKEDIGGGEDIDGAYLMSSNMILLCDTLCKNKSKLKQVFLHEFIHMIRVDDLAMIPFSFLPDNLFKIYDKYFLDELGIGMQELKIFLFRWREEAICELLSYYILLQYENLERNELQYKKPLFIYLMSGGFNDNDMIKMKKYIFDECVETLKTINNLLVDNKISIDNFEEYFNYEYNISEMVTAEINKIKKTPLIAKSYKQFSKRVFF